MVKRGIRIYYFLHSFSCHTCTFCLFFYHFTFWLVAWVCFLWGNRFCICLCSVIVFANYFTSPPLLYYYYYYLKKKKHFSYVVHLCLVFTYFLSWEFSLFLKFVFCSILSFVSLPHLHMYLQFIGKHIRFSYVDQYMKVRMVVRVKLSNFTQTGTCN